MVHRPLQSPCQATDALLVDGRNATFLTCWLHTSGLTTPLPILQDTARMGMRIRSMGLTSRFGPEFISWPGANGDDLTLELVQVSLFPHLDHPNFPPNRTTNAEQRTPATGRPPCM